MPTERLIIGVMTGTSVDGVDAAAVRVDGHGLAIRAQVSATASLPLDQIRERLRDFTNGAPATAAEIASLRRALSIRCAEAVRTVAERVGDPDLVVVHGQTVRHAPPVSWQALDPWPVAAVAGCPVLHDLRGADLARGGEGAPITPLADWVLFRHGRESRAIVNLGGFCNATILPAGARPDDVRGFDVCACNHVLDGAARAALDAPYDSAGAVAAAGEPDSAAAGALREALEAQGGGGRSLGDVGAAQAWVDAWAPRLPPEALLASAVDAVSAVIADDLAPLALDRILLAGGAVRNRALTAALARRLASTPVATTSDAGVPPEQRESAGLAVLGALCQDGVDATLPTITGARTTPTLFAGSWTNLPPTRATRRR